MASLCSTSFLNWPFEIITKHFQQAVKMLCFASCLAIYDLLILIVIVVYKCYWNLVLKSIPVQKLNSQNRLNKHYSHLSVNKHLNCSLHSRLINNSIPDTAACLGKSTCRGSKKAAMVRLIDIRCKVIQVAVIRPSLHS